MRPIFRAIRARRASWRGAVLDTMSFVLRPVSDNDVVSLFELETGERLWFLRVTGASDTHCSQHPIPPMKRRLGVLEIPGTGVGLLQGGMHRVR